MNRIAQLTRWMLPALLVLLGSAPAWACPTCKNGMAGNDGLVAGYQWSILFMMSMPFTILGLFSAYMYWEVRRARARQEAEAAAEHQLTEPTGTVQEASSKAVITAQR